MKKLLISVVSVFAFSFFNAQLTTVTRTNTLIKSNHNFGLTNQLYVSGSTTNVMQYDAGMVNTNGAAFTFNFTNPGGTGYKGYPSGTVGGYKSGGVYSPGNVATSGMPVLISDLQDNLRIRWKVSQQNANDADDKWWASINVIFDSGTATSEPDPNVRDYDLVIASKQYMQESLADEPKVVGGGAYWYFAKNTDGSLKTFDLNIDGAVYKYALRYKFFSYNVGDPNYDKNDKVHTKFIPIDNNNTAPYLDHSLKLFIQTTKDYIQYANLPAAELALANQKVADPTLYIKSIAAGYEVYTGSFIVNNDYFYTVLDSTAPSVPANLTGVKSGNSVTLDWDNSTDNDFNNYKVYRSVNGGSFSLLADNLYVSNYVDNTINSGNTYQYYVVTQDRSFNTSAQSNAYSLTINPSFTPQQMVAMMGTGINFGNILSAPYEGNWADPLTETYVDNVARLGFKTVRIPIRFDNQTTPLSAVTYTGTNGAYIGSPANYTVNVSYLNRINTIIDWCTYRNLIPIIDVHGDAWFWESFKVGSANYKTGNDRLAAIDRFKAIWRDISTTFQNKPETVLFEIMNEAFFSMSAAEVNDINAQMLAVIRQTNPTRNVIVTGGGQNSYLAPLQMSDAFIQSDSHLIATYHYYQPFKFTSSSTQTSPDFDWGTATDKQKVDTEFQAVKDWSVQKNIPVYMGEFGADNVNGHDYETGAETVGPDAASRFAFHQYVAEAARTRGFALTVWDSGHKSGKTIYLNPSESWVKDVRNAVLNSTGTNQTFINNADIGNNYDYNWTITTTNASAKINNATQSNSLSGASLNAIVASTTGNINNVIVSNDAFTSNITAGKSYNFKFYAKADAGQKISANVKAIVNGVTTNTVLSTSTLSNNYQQYTTSNYVIPTGTTSLQFQILCGESIGNYYFDNFTTEEAITSTVWNGTSWSNGIPNANLDAVINGNYSGASFTSKNLTVNNGYSLTINSNVSVTANNVINNGSVTVNDGGNFIQTVNSNYSGNGTFTLNKNSQTPATEFAFWSSPVANQNMFNIFGANTPRRINLYNPSTNYFVQTTTAISTPGTGYSIKARVTGYPATFQGTPNNGLLTKNLTYVSGLGSGTYNLVGNPYPSNLNLVDFYNANSLIIDGSFYFWDNTTTNITNQSANNFSVGYATYNALSQTWVPAPSATTTPTGNVVAATQGFMVKAINSANTSLSFNNSMRSSTSGKFFNRVVNDSKTGKYWLKLSSPDAHYTIAVTYDANASDKADGFDSKIFSEDNNKFYSYIGADKFSIQGRKEFNESDVVSIGTNNAEDGNYTISLTDKNGLFEKEQSIFLHDKLTDIYTDLQNESYTFTAQSGEMLNRFEIVYNAKKSGVNMTYSSFNVYRDSESFVVVNDKEIQSLELIDFSGKIVKRLTVNSKSVKINPEKGVYLLKVLSNGKIYTKKIIK